MIRSTKTSLEFSNTEKLIQLHSFIKEYRTVVSKFVDILWTEEKISPLIPKETTSQITTWLSARAVQCAAKQASGIVRGTRTKQNRRLWQINKFIKDGCAKKARKLQRIYDNIKQSKPNIDNVECELDSRFVEINLNNPTSFDGWITLTCLGNNLKLKLPFKKHKHFNKMLENGKIKTGVRLSKKNITFMFNIEDTKLKDEGTTLGIDIGQTTTLSCSDNQSLDSCPHSHTYATICAKLARKKKGSKAFGRSETHRSNYLHYIVNKLNLDGVRIVNRENIKNLRKFSNTSRKLKHWNYAELFDVLDNKLAEQGVLVNKINPTYTSQRCSMCGWTQKANRKGKQFKCDKCFHEQDADLNASKNLALNLTSIKKLERLQHKSRIGFYWNVVGKEPIVPSVQKS